MLSEEPLCAFCGTELETGFLELRSSFLSFLSHGWSYLVLTFFGSETFEVDLVKPTERVVTRVCPSCSNIVITNEPWLP